MSVVRFFALRRFNHVDGAGLVGFGQLLHAGEWGYAVAVMVGATIVSIIVESVARS